MARTLICLSCNYFCLNRLACRHRTIHKMKSLFHPVYRYIFCLPSRRSRQIIRRALEIVYSFCSFVCSSSSFIWQHVPDSSFSLVCILQHFVSSIGMFHTPSSHLRWLLLNHSYTSDTDIYLAYLNGCVQNNDIHNYSFYI